MHWWRAFVGSNVPGYRQRQRQARGNAVIGLLGGFSVVYLLSEFALTAQIHPIHWGAAGISAVAIYLASYVWLLRRSYMRHSRKHARG